MASPRPRTILGIRLDEAAAYLIESSEDAILSASMDGTVISWNAAAEHLYGYTADEVVGKSTAMLLVDDRPDAGSQPVRQFESIRRHKDGTLLHVSLRVIPILDKSGDVGGVWHVARDISERKRFEEQAEWFDAMVESAEDAIISKTAEGTVLTWNSVV